MELQTINQVSKDYGISTRMLRYYEKIGLIQSLRKNDYAYRVYDETALRRLQKIVILRKLRISMKQIGMILSEPKAAEAIEIFRQNIRELDDEINALSVIRNILIRLAAALQEQANVRLEIDTLMDSSVLSIVNSLSLSKNYIRENAKMDDLKKADEQLNKLTDVRVIYIPPMTVAASHATGENCEGKASDALHKFVKESGLFKINPGARHFGFDCSGSNPPPGQSGVNEVSHGYEMWVSVPDDMDVPAPLIKRTFHGGLYAAHMIKIGGWDDWGLLKKWVLENGRYDHDWGTARWSPFEEGMEHCLEEQLNFINNIQNPNFNGNDMQLDLLFPIKPKIAARTQHTQEKIIGTFSYNGASVEVVEWIETIWCGKIGYNNTTANNPDKDWVRPILDGFFALDTSSAKQRVEPDWDVCMNVNLLSKERPDGVMFGFLVGTEQQPDGFDVYKLPAGQYLRIAITDESAKALGAPPWNGGVPPYEWVGEQLAPQFGYHYGDERMPVFEYYGYYKADKNAHDFHYLYVPVEKI